MGLVFWQNLLWIAMETVSLTAMVTAYATRSKSTVAPLRMHAISTLKPQMTMVLAISAAAQKPERSKRHRRWKGTTLSWKPWWCTNPVRWLE